MYLKSRKFSLLLQTQPDYALKSLAGPTCLTGDVIGDYGVDAVPNVGDLLVFGDMAIYTTCKNNTFNGMPLPAIFARAASGTTRSIVSFGYEDFKYRLGKR